MNNYQQGEFQQPYQQQAAQQPYAQGFQQPYSQVPEAPAMEFGEAVKKCLKNFAEFNGRATRAEFWWFQLFAFIVNLALGWIPVLGWLVSLALFIPTLAVSWRRLHDMGKAGGWWFIGLIPLVGWIFCIIWYCTKSEPMDNRFGPYLG